MIVCLNYRYRLFCVKKGETESHQLSPCLDSLQQHVKRANYQTAILKRALGWTIEDGELSVHWMDGQPAPNAVLELLSCKCSRMCKLPECCCMSNGLPCTDMCKLITCANQRNEDEDDSDAVGLNDEDSDLSDDKENVSE